MKVSGNDERVQRSTRQTFNHHENERKEAVKEARCCLSVFQFFNNLGGKFYLTAENLNRKIFSGTFNKTSSNNKAFTNFRNKDKQLLKNKGS